MPHDRTEVPDDAARRRFLQSLGGLGLALGASPLLKACGTGGGDASAAAAEQRTYYLSLPNAQAGTQYVLEAGLQQYLLTSATPAHLMAARADAPGAAVESITHVAENIALPAHSPQLCFVKGRDPAQPGPWHLHSMFMHVPLAGQEAAARCATAACSARAALLRSRVITGGPAAAATTAGNVCAQYPAYKDYFDHAAALIATHPELLSFDTTTMAYVQQNIICTDENTLHLAVALYQQGVAQVATSPDVTTALADATSGWGVLVPVMDPDTNTQMRDAGTGDLVYHTVYTALTMRLLGQAIQSVLPKVKNDPMLGTNISDLPAGTANPQVQGKLWVVQNGPATVLSGTGPAAAVPRTVSAMQPIAAAVGSTLTYTLEDVENSAGCSITYDSNNGRTINFSVRNWYLRYLGLYARFLDAADKPIPLSALDDTTLAQFPRTALNGTYDGFMSIVNQETVVMGIPVAVDSQSFSITLPENAASVLLLAGGLGTGKKNYPDTITPGMVMTVVLDIALPSVFLILGAATGLAALTKRLSAGGEIVAQAAMFFIQAMTDAGLIGRFGDPGTFMNLIVPLGSMFIKMIRAGGSGQAAEVAEAISSSLSSGETTSKIPLVGTIMLAVASLAAVAQITETSVEVGRSDWTLARKVRGTHDLTVTVLRDPADTAGFPQTAVQYKIEAQCDGASLRHSGWITLADTNVDSLTYTFKALPAGGKVTLTATFQSASGWGCGAGSVGPIDNTVDSATITITEILVPLDASTVYSHNRKLTADAGGRHAWQATTTPPSSPVPNCDNAAGTLCELVGITLSEPFGALGYEWRASNAGVTEFGGAGSGQLYQFANVAFTGDPEAGYMFSGSGFLARAPMAYDPASVGSHSYYVDSSGDGYIVRRIVMGGLNAPPTFDAPGSNLAVGRLRYAPDAFLLHHTGKIISLNGEASRMEVLLPAATPVADSDAPISVALSGPGSRDGLMAGPVAAAVSQGYVVVLEQGNGRLQAFDTGGNPAKLYQGATTPFVALKARGNVTYLDLAAEKTGYLYVLVDDRDLGVFAMDIYDPDGNYVATTNDVRGSRLVIDLFRNAYLLNFEGLTVAGRVEPGVSEWIPSTPAS